MGEGLENFPHKPFHVSGYANSEDETGPSIGGINDPESYTGSSPQTIDQWYSYKYLYTETSDNSDIYDNWVATGTYGSPNPYPPIHSMTSPFIDLSDFELLAARL